MALNAELKNLITLNTKDEALNVKQKNMTLNVKLKQTMALNAKMEMRL